MEVRSITTTLHDSDSDHTFHITITPGHTSVEDTSRSEKGFIQLDKEAFRNLGLAMKICVDHFKDLSDKLDKDNLPF